MGRIKAGRHIFVTGLVLAILLMTLSLCTITTLAEEQEPTSGKHLVIKIVEEEEDGLYDLKNSEVPLAAFPGVSQQEKKDDSGSRHVVLMAVMLAVVVGFVFYCGRSETKLIRLRRRAAQVEYGWMLERISSDESEF